MKKDANDHLDYILNSDLDQYGHITNDKRVTKIGKVLRKYWIDELPQFYNILKGDMKLVGVRPIPDKRQRFPSSIQDEVLQQKPGLCAIQYSHTEKGDFMENEFIKQYLNEYQKHPFATDLKYFLRIWRNIISHGTRSS